jgi:hypothetical protein
MQLALALAPADHPRAAVVHAHLDACSGDLPTCVRRVIDVVGPDRGFVATIEVFDGRIATVRCGGNPAHKADVVLSQQWIDVGGAPFGWCERRRRWVRYPKEGLR